MPCSGILDECKRPGIESVDNSSAQENLSFVTGSPDAVFAHMGWVGFAKLTIPVLDPTGTILRVTSADINLSQEITTPDVIDGRIDRTVYQLGPKIVQGSISMPVIADVDPAIGSPAGCVTTQQLTSGSASSLLDNIWCWATARSPHGRLQYADASLDIRYANHAAFHFDKCIANTLGMSVTNTDVITFDIDVIGRSRTPASEFFQDDVFTQPQVTDFLAPARVLTWNDITITGVGGCDDAFLFGSAQVREFSFEIANNADWYYSLNGQLFPVDINVSKREITGSIKLMGLQDALRLRAENQQREFTRKDEIRMMIFIGDEATSSRDWIGTQNTPQAAGHSPIFWKKFTGVIFQIEEMSLTNDVFETDVNWLALGNDQENYLAISPGSSCLFPSWG